MVHKIQCFDEGKVRSRRDKNVQLRHGQAALLQLAVGGLIIDFKVQVGTGVASVEVVGLIVVGVGAGVVGVGVGVGIGVGGMTENS